MFLLIFILLGISCETDILECKKSPCKNNGTCVEQYGKFHCNCKPGFSGQLCEVNVNDCSLNACGNNGQCIDGINDYTCNCSTGFNGRQ